MKIPIIFYVLILCVVLTLPVAAVAAQNSLPLMKAREMTAPVDVRLFSVSEKYDGVRALWTGRQLLTRSGNPIAAPDWFTAGLPADRAVEGELWLGYGRFTEVSALVRRYSAADEHWREVKLMAFDLPGNPLGYSQRLAELEQLQKESAVAWFQVVRRFSVASQAALDEVLAEVVEAGGEGLMLNRLDAFYQPIRTDAILKLKPEFDAEAEVIGYSPGKGKFDGMMGSLIVRDDQGRSFKIGTGFSDAQRENPPGIGQWITFRYSGFTSSGLPKFPRFVRVYEEI